MIIALVCSLPFLIVFIGAAIEGNVEAYQMTQEQLEEARLGFIFATCVVVFIDGIVALLLAFVGRRIKRIKALGNP